MEFSFFYNLVDELSNNSQLVYIIPCLVVFPTLSLYLTPVSGAFKAVILQRSFKSAGINYTTGVITEGCTHTLVHDSKYIYNMSLSQQYFLSLWNAAVNCSCSQNRQRFIS
jgi:hypothetical protein